MGMMLRALSPWIAAFVFCSSAAFAEPYGLSTANEKLVDNHGDGYAPLYGTRNVRAVLSGVLYRGGANNAYHHSNPRNNQNPLPDDGLMNLCQEGFSQAIYLYPTRFATAPHSISCRTNSGAANHLEYRQVSVLNLSGTGVHDFLEIFARAIRNPSEGPIYAHCWNGWHASGITGAYALRQFCGFDGEEAVAYWNKNTDGNDGSGYNGIRAKIRAFVPFEDLLLTDAERASICPRPGSLAF